MMTYKEYSDIVTQGSYICVKPTPDSVDSLLDVGQRAGIDLDTEDLHVTLMYSYIGVPTVPINSRIVYECTPTKFSLFGENKDFLVLELDCPALKIRHRELLEYGLTHSYASYKPHVTLAKEYSNKVGPSEDLLKNVTLYFTNETHTPLEE